MSTCVVVGGGVVGMLCALVAKSRHQHVVLVEKADRCGGLLGSFERNGAIYDYGTHIPGPTGISALDELLYGEPAARERDYHSFHYLLSENYHNGRWYPSSPLIDARTLPDEQYQRGVLEMLLAPGAAATERNLLQHLIGTFGTTFTEAIYRPVLRKLVGEELENLDREVLRLFGLERLIVLTPEVSRDLKKVRGYDASMGFHSYTEGASTIPYVYPKGNRGISFWPAQLEAKLRGAGVEILTREGVKRIHLAGGRAKAVELESGRRIAADLVLWTIPPVFACQAAGLQLTGPRPRFCSHTLVHLRYANPLLKSAPQYVLVWDPARLSYRITLYPNITPDRRAEGTNHLTVEVLGDPSSAQSLGANAAKVEREMVEIGIVAEDNQVLDRSAAFLGPSFPVMTPEFLDGVERQAGALRAEVSNLLLLGRGGTTFFINDLLRHAWRTLEGIR